MISQLHSLMKALERTLDVGKGGWIDFYRWIERQIDIYVDGKIDR